MQLNSIASVAKEQRESDRNIGCLKWRSFKLSTIVLHSLTLMAIARNSTCGTVIRVNGVTRVFAVISRDSYFPSGNDQRMNETAHMARGDPSTNVINSGSPMAFSLLMHRLNRTVSADLIN